MISVNATVARYSITEQPVYYGTLSENGSIDLRPKSSGDIRWNLTPEENVPEVARQVMESYGGIPLDAQPNGVSTHYLRQYNLSRNEVVSEEPMFTTISYSQADVNGLWVVGDTNLLILDLGDYGELLWIHKIWRDYTYSGNVPVISLNSAFNKFQHGELLNDPTVMNEKITIDIASPGYYAKTLPNNDTTLEPIWMLFGETESGARVGFYVYARQFANFTATPTEVTKWGAVQFTDTSDASPTKWYWEFGDGTNSTEQNPLHLYRDGGNYTVNLTVRNDMGSDTISREDYVRVNYGGMAPVANFTSNYSYNNHYSPAILAFLDTSTGVNLTWYWDFDDGTNSTEQNPVHLFMIPDDSIRDKLYSINLTVSDDVGRVSTHLDNIFIQLNVTPDFIAEPRMTFVNETITFTDLTPRGNGSSSFYNTSYFQGWDFGDGTELDWLPRMHQDWERPPVSVTHEYQQPGNYTVSLTTDLLCVGECPITTTKVDYITIVTDVTPLITDFSANITRGRNPLAVAFTDVSNGSPTNWNWSFGDGTMSIDQHPVHVYSAAGTYTISLIATDEYRENASTKVDYISVYEPIPPVADFAANVTSGYEPLAVAFNDTSVNTPDQWNWSFGDGTISTEKNPVHLYLASGNYSVSLQVTNEYGTDMMVKNITVIWAFPIQTIVVPPTIPPVANFSGTPVFGKEPLQVVFNDTSTGSPLGWAWSFGDSGVSAEQNPVHVYTKPGKYSVSLKVTSNDGSDTMTRPDYITVTSQELPVPEFPFIGHSAMSLGQLVSSAYLREPR